VSLGAVPQDSPGEARIKSKPVLPLRQMFMQMGDVTMRGIQEMRRRFKTGVRTGAAAALLLPAVAHSSEPSSLSPFSVGTSGGGYAQRLAQDPHWQAAEQDSAERKRRAGVESTEEKRRESRRKFRGLSDDRAIEIAESVFPAEFAGPIFDGTGRDREVDVIKYVGSFGAWVEPEGSSRRLLLQASAPLRVRDQDGDMRPVSLRLQPAAEGLKKVEHAAIPSALGADAVRAELADEGLGLRLSGARVVNARQSHGRMFYGNAFVDTDAGLAPDPYGFELSLQLRSPESPESYGLDVELPVGATIGRVSPEGGIPGDPPQSFVAKGKDGEVLGYIHPPTAYDALGVPVETEIVQVAPRRLEWRVVHRERADLTYPLYADPLIRQVWNSTAGWSQWRWRQFNRAMPYYSFGAQVANCDYRCGALYQSMPSGSWFYHGDYARYDYQAPPQTFVYRAVLGGMGTNYVLCSNNQICAKAFHGLATHHDSIAWEYGGYVNQSGGTGGNPWIGDNSYSGIKHDYCTLKTTRPDGGVPRAPADCSYTATDTNFAQFGIQAQVKDQPYSTSAVYTGSTRSSNHMDWAEIYLGDRHAPQVASPTPSSVWRDDLDQPSSIGFRALDVGMGVYEASLTRTDGTTETKRAPSAGPLTGIDCTGDWHRARCPNQWSPSFTRQLSEGTSAFTAKVQEAFLKTSPATTITQRIDRSKPVLADADIGGTLWNARNNPDDHRREGLYESSYTLTARASDDFSGMAAIEIFVDGQSKHMTACAASPCDVAPWALDTADLTEGDHEIKIEARDALASSMTAANRARHVKTRSFTVTVDRIGDVYAAFVHDDASGDEALATREWHQPSTHAARQEDGGAVKTRDTVSCEESAGGCAEMRLASGPAGAPGQPKIFTRYRGTSPDDGRIESVAEIASLRASNAAGNASSSGPITDVLLPWQRRPPAASSTYELFVRSSQQDFGQAADGTSGETVSSDVKTVTEKLWADADTGYPLKHIVEISGEVVSERYFSYAVARRSRADLAGDFFSVPRPANVEQEKVVEYRDQEVGAQVDPATTTSYEPYFLGDLPIIGSASFCLRGSAIETLVDNHVDSATAGTGELQPLALAPAFQRVTATYARAGSSGSCVGARNDDPAVTIRSAASASSLAQAWRDAYLELGSHIELTPQHEDAARAGLISLGGLLSDVSASAHVITLDDEQVGAYLEVGETAVVITGSFGKAQLPDIVELLEIR
jgi:hypothetical protein